MSKLTIDYSGIESDISTLTSNITTINSSLDSINSVEKIIPDSWQSNAASQYRSTVASDLVAPIAGIQEGLNSLKDLLSVVLTKYNEEETQIRNNVPSGASAGISNISSTPSGGSSSGFTYIPSTPSSGTNTPTEIPSTPSTPSTPSEPANNPTLPS